MSSSEGKTVTVPREPTPGMLRQGIATLTMPWDSVIPPDVDPDTYIMGMVWAAMVEAAVPVIAGTVEGETGNG